MGYVFINYSSQDATFAKRLVSDLNASGIGTWFDSDNLLPGVNFANNLGEAIKGASVMIIVVSKHAIYSRWVIEELAYATSRNILTIPFLIDDTDMQTIASYMKSYQIIDARRNYDLALKALLAVLPNDVQHSQKSSPGSMGANGYVFLSYANPDAAFIDRLKGYLKTRNYAYWDYRETSRDFQSFLSIELERAIKSAKATLCILSPSWKTSEWTINEYAFSAQIGRPTILLKVKEFEPILLIAAKTYIDFTSGFESGARVLDQELARYGLL